MATVFTAAEAALVAAIHAVALQQPQGAPLPLDDVRRAAGALEKAELDAAALALARRRAIHLHPTDLSGTSWITDEERARWIHDPETDIYYVFIVLPSSGRGEGEPGVGLVLDDHEDLSGSLQLDPTDGVPNAPERAPASPPEANPVLQVPADSSKSSLRAWVSSIRVSVFDYAAGSDERRRFVNEAARNLSYAGFLVKGQRQKYLNEEAARLALLIDTEE
jgi:hypothetical protein